MKCTWEKRFRIEWCIILLLTLFASCKMREPAKHGSVVVWEVDTTGIIHSGYSIGGGGRNDTVPSIVSIDGEKFTPLIEHSEIKDTAPPNFCVGMGDDEPIFIPDGGYSFKSTDRTAVLTAYRDTTPLKISGGLGLKIDGDTTGWYDDLPRRRFIEADTSCYEYLLKPDGGTPDTALMLHPQPGDVWRVEDTIYSFGRCGKIVKAVVVEDSCTDSIHTP